MEEANEDRLTRAGAKPASTSCHADLPADARCPRCDYQLRGLTETRCPECGSPFDPLSFRHLHEPLWPRLLLLILIAEVGRQSIGILTRALLLWSRRGVLPDWLMRPPALAAGTQTILAVLVGIPAIIGLYRRRDWGRQVGLVMLALLSGLGIVRALLAYPDGATPVADALCSSSMPYLILLAFLATGLRRRSLTSGSRRGPVLIPNGKYDRRSDWAMLFALAGVTMVMKELPYLIGGEMTYAWIWSSPQPLVHRVCSAILPFALWLNTIMAGCATCLVWRRPSAVRGGAIMILAGATSAQLVIAVWSVAIAIYGIRVPHLDGQLLFLLLGPSIRGLLLPALLALFAFSLASHDKRVITAE